MDALWSGDGKIIGSGYNEILKHHGDQIRHAEIIAIERAKSVTNDPKLTGCTVYTTASPCDQCAYNIRTCQEIKRVCIGVDSEMKGPVLQSPALARLGEPFGKPPEVDLLNITELKRKFFDLYIAKKGWNNQFPSLVRESMIPGDILP